MGDADDGDFDYDDAAFDPRQFDKGAFGLPSGRPSNGVQVQHQYYDEEASVSESPTTSMSPDSPPSHRGYSPAGPDASRDTLDSAARLDATDAAEEDPRGHSTGPASPAAAGSSPQPNSAGDASGLPPGYNPQDYANLDVTPDVQDLFKFIGRYRPAAIELEARLKPFIPDFQPALGSIDEFIKVPRPDGRPDWLGLKVLDEPATQQSDPALLMLQLRQLSRQAAGDADQAVGSLPHADPDRNRRLDAWIANTAQVHKGRGVGAVLSYSGPMPDLELLMAEWPQELEAALSNMKLPSSTLDLDLSTYSRLVCGLLDIPVHGPNLLESLHLLCCLVLEFRANPFLRQHLDSPDLTLRTASAPPGSSAGRGLWSAGPCPASAGTGTGGARSTASSARGR